MRATVIALASALALATIAAAPLTLQDEPSAELPQGCRLIDYFETPEDAADDIQICTKELFIHAGDTPLSNVSSATFSTDAPSGPAPIGGAAIGGSVTDIALQGDPAHGLEVSGTFTGAVDSAEVQVYILTPNGVGGGHGTTPALEIDGLDFAGALVDTSVQAGPNGTSLATFRISNMLEYFTLAEFDLSPDAVHTLRLNLSPYYFGDDGAYLYDGTDVPSSVVLNRS